MNACLRLQEGYPQPAQPHGLHAKTPDLIRPGAKFASFIQVLTRVDCYFTFSVRPVAPPSPFFFFGAALDAGDGVPDFFAAGFLLRGRDFRSTGFGKAFS